MKDTVPLEFYDFSNLKAFISKHSFSSIIILCDTNTKKHCLPKLIKASKALQAASIICIPTGEKHKTLTTLHSIWTQLLATKADKNTLLICLGGGVVCDVGGFAAATYKRGIAFVNVPTTLLAMVDAAIGGKNGIDFMGYKNILGTITQPQGIFLYEGFLKTLPAREIKSGFAEIIKAMAIQKTGIYEYLLMQKTIPTTKLIAYMGAAIGIKERIVAKDPTEKGIRQALNFGHTVGHAIEAYYLGKKNELLHGEAIAIGMCVELFLGKILKLTDDKTVTQLVAFIKIHYAIPAFTAKEINAFINLMQQDKKNKDGKLTFALLKKVGKPITNIHATTTQVQQAFEMLKASI